MNEQSDDPHPADKLIGADWRPPRQVQMEKAWTKLDPAKRKRFTELQREHGWKDVPRIERLEDESEEAAWVEYELRPSDPRDEAKPELIDRWPVKLELDEDNRVQAIIAELRED